MTDPQLTCGLIPQVVQRLVESVLRRVNDAQPGSEPSLPIEEGPQLRHLLHRCEDQHGGDDEQNSDAARLRGCLGREAEGIMDAVLHMVFKEHEVPSTDHGGGGAIGGSSSGGAVNWNGVLEMMERRVTESKGQPIEVCDSLPSLPINSVIMKRIKTRLEGYFGRNVVKTNQGSEKEHEQGSEEEHEQGNEEGQEDSAAEALPSLSNQTGEI